MNAKKRLKPGATAIRAVRSGTQINHTLPDGLLLRYKAAFVPSHYPPFAIQTRDQATKRQWFTVNRRGVYLTDPKVEKHLNGDYHIGTIPKVFTRSIIVDIDIDDGGERSLDQRTEKVCSAFPEMSPLAFSTPRRGRHLHFILEKPEWSDRAQAFARDRLTDAGVLLAPGQVELFPAGGKAIRAPLGRDCFLLDNHTLEPVHPDRMENLHTLNEILANDQYDTLAVPGDFRVTVPEEQRRSSCRRVRSYDSDNEFMHVVDRLLREGLWRPSQRQEALLKLNWFMHVIWRFDSDSVEKELCTWISQHHNGFSKDFKRDPQWVYRDIREKVRAFDPDKASTKQTETPPRVPRKAEEDLQARIQEFLRATPLDDHEKTLLAKIFGYAHRHGEDTPDGRSLNVEIPSRTLQSFNRQYGPILKALMTASYVKKTRNYGADIKRCNTYRVPRLDTPV